MVVVNTNDVAKNRNGYFALFEQCAETIFAAWDWDNHHWLEMSAPLAATCDVYAPSHHESLYLLSRYNWIIAGPVYCATVQWSSSFLKEALVEMITNQRGDMPL